jgi:peptide/nickel transport system substrate-binding protein
MIVKDWSQSSDGLTWDFTIHEGIMFHEGWGEITTEEVIFSLELATQEGTTNGFNEYFKPGGGHMDSWEIIDRYSFRFHLTEPQPDLEYHMSNGEATSITSKAYYETVGTDAALRNPIGSSPWRLIEHKPAEFVRYEAVVPHWRQTPDFKYLKVLGVPEVSTQLAMLKTGAADITEIPGEFAAEMEDAGLNLKRRSGGGAAQLLLGGQVLPTRAGFDPDLPWAWHQDEAPAYADHAAGWGKLKPGGSDWNRRALMVRMALFYSIDVDAMIAGIFHGEAERVPIGAAGGWAQLGSPWLRPEHKLLPYDPVLAKQLLVDAGYPDGFDQPIKWVMFPHFFQLKTLEIGEAIARDWEAIGLDVERWMTEYVVQRPIFAAREASWMVKLDPWPIEWEPWTWIGSFMSSTNEGYNDGMESVEADALVRACADILDTQERIPAILDLADFFYDQYLVGPLFVTNRVFCYSDKIEYYPLNIAPWNLQSGRFEYTIRAK